MSSRDNGPVFNERSDIVFPQDMFTVITARHYCRYQGTVITYTLKCKQKQRHLHKLNNKHGATTSLVRDTQREWGFVLSCWVRCWKWAQMELNSNTWRSPDSAYTSIPYMYSCTFCLSCHIYFNSLHHLPLFPGSWAVKFTDISLSWGVKNAEVLQYSLMAFFFFFWMQIRSSCFSLHGHKTTTGKL